jgi:hypothetical protein
VYFDGYASPNIPFAGVVPGYPSGLYQINAQIPCNVSTGNDYVDILTPDAEAEQVTLGVAGTCHAGVLLARATSDRKPSGRGRRATPRESSVHRVVGVSR